MTEERMSRARNVILVGRGEGLDVVQDETVIRV
jgi:hypothetical protein